MSESCVYVLGTPGSNTVKIGRTTNLERRVADIQRMSPVPLVVLWTHLGGHELETWLHRYFASQRAHGEWFAFEDDPVPLIQEAVTEALRPKVAPPPPPLAVDSIDTQRALDLVAEAGADHRAKRAELEIVIAEARRAGLSLTLISEHTPFSREWVRRIADRIDRERATLSA